jgi:anti-sigma factor RsiW
MRHRDEFTDQLSAYLDHELSPAERGRLEEHVGGCAECRAVLGDLRAIVAAAPLYEGTPPATDLWPSLAARLDEAKVVALPTQTAPAPRRGLRRFSLPELVAASLVTAALGAGGAWLALRPAPATSPALVAAPAPAPSAPALGPDRALTVSFPDADFDAAVADLEQVLLEGRSRLDTTTVRVIDESLARIDAAIEDARSAIQRDPANAYLTRQITANMRRKLNLLRTAARAIAEL